jgi:transcriptional regulator with XRE-family HTH domain
MTQAEVADALGVDQSLWSKWERGQRAPDLLRLMEFAHRAGTSIELICFGVIFRTAPELADALSELAREDHTIVFRAENYSSGIDQSLRLGAAKKTPARRTG